MSSKNNDLTELFVNAEADELAALRSEFGKLRRELDEKNAEIGRLKNRPSEGWADREIERAKTELAAAYRDKARAIRNEASLIEQETFKRRCDLWNSKS